MINEVIHALLALFKLLVCGAALRIFWVNKRPAVGESTLNRIQGLLIAIFLLLLGAMIQGTIDRWTHG
jgi:hypothetical protein